MTRAELVARLAEQAGLSPDDAEAAVEALFAVDGGIVAAEVGSGGVVEIGEFGSFEPRLRYGSATRARRGAEDDEGPPPAPVFRAGDGWRDAGRRLRGRRNPPRGTGSTGPRREIPTGSTGPRGEDGR